MKNKALYIGLGVVALGGLIYFMMRKKGADSVETKSAEATDATAATTPSKGLASTMDTTAPVVATATVPTSTGADPLFAKWGITTADFNKMEAKRAEIKQQLRNEIGRTPYLINREGKKRLKEFAKMNNISWGGYKMAQGEQSKRMGFGVAPVTSATDQMDSETETFAFNLTF